MVLLLLRGLGVPVLGALSLLVFPAFVAMVRPRAADLGLAAALAFAFVVFLAFSVAFGPFALSFGVVLAFFCSRRRRLLSATVSVRVVAHAMRAPTLHATLASSYKGF